MKLFIIADDFTGAMDTGVQFAVRGAKTQVVTDPNYKFGQSSSDIQVLVMDAETRHLPPKEAYRVVYQTVRAARDAGVPYIYKKTDSALRGNVGSELSAVMDAAGQTTLPFIPAFPAMNRVTRDGVHYIDGIPVAQSDFGKDPFEPVCFSGIRSILGEQTDKPVVIRKKDDLNGGELQGIQVFDAETNDDMKRICQMLGADGLHISAGCAGFASELAELLNLDGESPTVPPLIPALFIACGSVNPVTKEQLAVAQGHCFERIQLSARQKLDDMWPESGECRLAIRDWLAEFETRGRLILDTNDADGGAETRRYMERHGLSIQAVRVRISTNLGKLMKELLDKGLTATLMCTGGDTLLALMQAVHVSELTPVCELDPGVVLTYFVYQEKTHYIISKSGGFGAPDLLCKLAALIGAGEREETVCLQNTI